MRRWFSWRGLALGAGLLCLMGLSAAGGWWHAFETRAIPWSDRAIRTEVDLLMARDSIRSYEKINRALAEEHEWYRLMIPPGSGIYHPAEITHQYYIHGRTKGRYLEMAYSANKYFAHRRRLQEVGMQRFMDASTPHESFLYEILDSLGVVPNDTARFDDNAQKIVYFVNSIPYHDKKDAYVKMPIETLVEGRGNCADLSILMHSLMITAGLDAMIVFPTKGDSLDHTMVGVHGDFNEDRTRTYFMYPDQNGTRYYLCQPTGTDDMRYPVMHKVGYSKRYPYTVIVRDSVTVVENKKEWLKRGRK